MVEAIKNEGDDDLRAKIKAKYADAGVISQAIDVLRAVEAIGSGAIGDVHACTLFHCVTMLTRVKDTPGCEAQIRDAATAVHFCVENPKFLTAAFGSDMTTGVEAAALAVAVFGRDESDDFVFTQTQVDGL